MSKLFKAPIEVQSLLSQIKPVHCPRLEEANIVICFSETKPFKKNRFNWGKAGKVPGIAEAINDNADHFDFSIIIPRASYEMLNADQKKALLDLHLESCQVEYLPEIVVENKKKKVVTDELGRTIYTDEIKRDDNGVPLWKLVPLDLPTFTANAKRHGCWCLDLIEIKEAINISNQGVDVG